MIHPIESEILETARELFRSHGPNFTMTRFRRLTGFPRSRIVRHFGGWLGLKARLGFPPETAPTRRISANRTANAILAALRDVIAAHGDSVTLHTFVRSTGISATCIYQRFGGWTALRKIAGLTSHTPARREYTDEQILADLWRVAFKTNQYLTTTLYSCHGRISLQTVQRRFGSFTEAMTVYTEFAHELHIKLPREEDRLSHIRSLTDRLTTNRKRHLAALSNPFTPASRLSCPHPLPNALAPPPR